VPANTRDFVTTFVAPTALNETLEGQVLQPPDIENQHQDHEYREDDHDHEKRSQRSLSLHQHDQPHRPPGDTLKAG
jgi:hypothetical protein